MEAKEVHAQVRDEVTKILCRSLEVEPTEVVPEARIMIELGAESIDLLDIRFGLERALGIRITNEELQSAFGAVESPREFMNRFTVGAMLEWLVTRLEDQDD